MTVVPLRRGAATQVDEVPCSWCGETQWVCRSLRAITSAPELLRCPWCSWSVRALAAVVDGELRLVRPRRRPGPPTAAPPPDRSRCASCKVFYPDEAAARAGLAAWRRRRRPGQSRGRVYRCPWCPGWHLTSNRRRRRPTR